MHRGPLRGWGLYQWQSCWQKLTGVNILPGPHRRHSCLFTALLPLPIHVRQIPIDPWTTENDYSCPIFSCNAWYDYWDLVHLQTTTPLPPTPKKKKLSRKWNVIVACKKVTYFVGIIKFPIQAVKFQVCVIVVTIERYLHDTSRCTQRLIPHDVDHEVLGSMPSSAKCMLEK